MAPFPWCPAILCPPCPMALCPPAPLTHAHRLAGGQCVPSPSVTSVQLGHVGSRDEEGPSPAGLAGPSHLPPVLVGFVEQQELLASSHGHMPPVLGTVRIVVEGTEHHGWLSALPPPPLQPPSPCQHPHPAQGTGAHYSVALAICRGQDWG